MTISTILMRLALVLYYGIITTARVVTISENLGKPVILQPGNCE